MVYSAVLSWQINFAFSVQVIFKDLHNLKRILKEIESVCKPAVTFRLWAPAYRKLKVTLSLLENWWNLIPHSYWWYLIELEKEWHLSEEETDVTGRRVLVCLLSSVPPLPSSALLTHPGKIINNYSASLHWVCYCPVSYKAYSAGSALINYGWWQIKILHPCGKDLSQS